LTKAIVTSQPVSIPLLTKKETPMSAFKKARQLTLAFITAALSCSAFPVTVTPTSLSIVAGSAQTLQLANVTGTISVSSSKSGVATVNMVSATSYRIDGVKAGSVTLSFKDKKNTAKVNVTVTADPSASLNGRLLASNCFQCHGTNGNGGFDKLAGKSASELYGELREFASGKEDADGIMAAHAMGFSDDQLKAIANYFSSIR
jgi:cytochrome subunit of sulfide dehydrogenase